MIPVTETTPDNERTRIDERARIESRIRAEERARVENAAEAGMPPRPRASSLKRNEQGSRSEPWSMRES
jgi:hypothetical protein